MAAKTSNFMEEEENLEIDGRWLGVRGGGRAERLAHGLSAGKRKEERKPEGGRDSGRGL